ncbi:MAG: radical SAM protein [Smithellaceae bacterium]
MTPKIILIHPPVAKPSEPPAGIAKLSASLTACGVSHRLIDANLEGMLHLLHMSAKKNNNDDHWSMRACKNLEDNLAAVRDLDTFHHFSRYTRAVQDIHRVLTLAGKPYGAMVTLADYADNHLSPVEADDLFRAAENPEANPFYPYFSGRLRQAMEESPAFIGFSLNYLSQALSTFAMIGFVKKINPRQKIILGGSLTTSWIQITGRNDFFYGLVDNIVAGAGEEKLVNLLGIRNVPTCASTDYRHLAENPYLSPGFILPYSAARGCWWQKCAFCPEKAEGNPYLPLSSSQVADELQVLTGLTNPSLIHLLDSAMAPALLKTLTQKPPGAPWYGFARVTDHLTDEDFCRALKKSGCAMLKLGIESGDQQVLDALHKGMDLPMASAALRALKRAGIATYCYFLFGTPPENETAALETLDFICRHADCIDFLNLAIFNLPAGSAEAQELSTSDFYAGDLSLYKGFHHPKGWQRQNVRHFLDKTLKKHPAIAPIIRRSPAFFT